MIRIFAFTFAFSVIIFSAANSALACTTCFGDPNSDQVKGAVMGVTFMLALTAFVLGSIGLIIFRFWRRAKDLNQSSEHSILPPAVQK